MISVIIATRNEANNIFRILKSLSEQTSDQHEVIVVDNGSLDGTVDIAEKFNSKIKVFSLPEKIKNLAKNQRGAQVNFGASQAKGNLLFFPDADMSFDPNLLDEASNLLTHVDALYIPEIIVGKGFFGSIRNYERSFYNATVIDAPRFVKAAVFKKIGGFDENNIVFGPDDWDLTLRLKDFGSVLDITNSSLYHHESDLTLLSYLNKKNNYLDTFNDYKIKWDGRDELTKQFGFWYRYVRVYFEQQKWIKVFVKPHLFISMMLIRVLVGCLYLRARVCK